MKNIILTTILSFSISIVFCQTKINLDKLYDFRNSSTGNISKLDWLATDGQKGNDTELSYITFERKKPAQLLTCFYNPNDSHNQHTRILFSFKDSDNPNLLEDDILSFLGTQKELKMNIVGNKFIIVYKYKGDILSIESIKNSISGTFNYFIWLYDFYDYQQNIKN